MLDEPSLGLAPLIVREIFRIIAELRRRGVSILLVEQNARAALQVADYAYVLENGGIKMHGEAGAARRPARDRELSRPGQQAPGTAVHLKDTENPHGSPAHHLPKSTSRSPRSCTPSASC